MQLIESTENKFTLRHAVESLGKIGTGNQTAIAALVQLIRSTQDDFTCSMAADTLWKIDPGNQTAIAALVQLIKSTENEDIRTHAAYSLRTIDPGNQTAIASLVQLSESTDGEETRWYATYSLGKIDSGNPTKIAALVQLLESSEDENTLCQVAESLGKIDPGNQTATIALVELLKLTEDDSIRWRVAGSLKKILRDEQLTGVVTSLKDYISDETHKNNFERFYQCYEVIWHCAQISTYPDFYQAWHNQLPLTRSLDLAELPQTLSVVIANNLTFSQTIHLICIDGSKFIDRDNPAAKIYTEMVKSGCPKCEDGTPKTMQELQAYWDLLDTDKRVVLVFYKDTGFSETFLDALSKFDGAICVITTQPMDNIPLQCFSPNQAIADVIEWLKQIA